jgi:acetyl esterase/lipase
MLRVRPTLFLLALATGFLPARAQTQPAPDSADIVFALADTVSLKLDVYYPPGKTAPHPLIIWIHGGGWQSGTRLNAGPALELVDSGYAVVSISYRLSQQALWPAQIHDCKAAVRWLRAHGTGLGLDTARMAVWGSSAGGHLANMIGLAGAVDSLEGTVGGNLGYSSRVRAAVDYYGPSNLPTLAPSHLTASAPEGLLLGCAITDCPDKARAASPITYVDAGDPPFLILHGTNDGTVVYTQSVELDSALRAVGVPVTFKTINGGGHGGPEYVADSSLTRVHAFLKNALGLSADTVPTSDTGTFTITGDPANATSGATWTYTGMSNGPAGSVQYDLTGILFKPATGAPPSGKFPAVIVNHGTGGNASGYGRTVAREMVKWGYVVIAPNLTHSGGGVPCGAPGACDTAAYWGASTANSLRGLKAWDILAGLGYVDTANVMAFGHSRGAWATTALGAAKPARFRALAHTAGGVVSNNAQGNAARDSMALKIRSPYLMHHGDSDGTVPLAFDRRLDSLLGAAGQVHRLDVYPGYDHPDISFDTTMFRKTREWYNTYRTGSTAVFGSVFGAGPKNSGAGRFTLTARREGKFVTLSYGVLSRDFEREGTSRSVEPMRIVIADMRGRRVSVLPLRAASEASRQRGSVVWEGRDLRGQSVPSGILWVWLESADGLRVAWTRLSYF